MGKYCGEGYSVSDSLLLDDEPLKVHREEASRRFFRQEKEKKRKKKKKGGSSHLGIISESLHEWWQERWTEC